ncbi:MAG: 2-amino-4-hydroxy-6-hydroxymethyldihydropteridine diphosphokinase [Candidatus Cryptobacteroides sp.]
MPKVELYLSLGSNLGDREGNLRKALELLDEGLGVHYKAVSSFLETEPWGFESDDRFINIAVSYDIELPEGFDPEEVGKGILVLCKETEASLGRISREEYDDEGHRIYHSRTIDVDILFLGYENIDCKELTVPHKMMAQRDFVLLPLSEIVSPGIREHFPDIFK